LLSTTNGVDWLTHYSGSHNNLRSVLYAEGAFFVVGNNDAILQSAQLFPRLRAGMKGAEGFELTVRAVPGHRHHLQASPDLSSWADVFTFQNEQETTTYLDADAGQHQHRFYRVYAEP